MGNNKKKKGGAKKAFLALPLAALLAVVAWMQGCVGDISEALGILSGGGASGPTANADGVSDPKTEESKKEAEDATPTPAEEQRQEEGAQSGSEIRILIEGKKISLSGTELVYDGETPEAAAAALTAALEGQLADDRRIYLNDKNGDYHVTEAVRQTLTKLGVTPVEEQ